LFFKNILLLFTYDLYVNINYLFYVKSALKSRDLFFRVMVSTLNPALSTNKYIMR
jgi:hypothetical protein